MPAYSPAVADVQQFAPKLPPQALEAEQSLLGGLLLDNRKWDEIAGLVAPGDFYHYNHRLIFEAIGGLRADSEPADVVTVGEWLDRAGAIEKAGGFAYLSTLANDTPSAANILTYAKIVRDQAVLRALIAAANDISALAYAPAGKDAGKVLEAAEKRVFDIAARDERARQEFAELHKLLDTAATRIYELSELDDPITGVATGFDDLDEMTSGLQRGDLVIVAGRPSMGKTALALNIAEYAIITKKLPVAVFSMEMPGEQLAMRLLAAVGQINLKRLRSGRLRDEDWPRMNSAVKLLHEAPMFINSSARLTPLELRSQIRRLLTQHREIGLIIIDYIQLMEGDDSKENRATEISSITRALKTMAMEFKVPIVALSQLNRGLEQRPNKRPVMSDLRESGAIEQDADVIFFIYRDEVYNSESADRGTAEVIIGKQRNGPIGTVKLTFREEYTRFENYAADRYATDPPPDYGAGGDEYDVPTM
ncbi:MAG: replicative DNA helicase [bacterium]